MKKLTGCSLFCLLLMAFSLAAEEKEPISLFRKHGTPVSNYTVSAAELSAGDTLKLGDQIVEIEAVFSAGDMTRVFKLKGPPENRVLRLAKEPHKSIVHENWLASQLLLEKIGVAVPRVYDFHTGGWAIVEEIKHDAGNFKSTDEIIAKLDPKIQTQAKVDLEKLVQSLAPLMVVGDLWPRQLAYEQSPQGNRWVVLDFDSVSMNLESESGFAASNSIMPNEPKLRQRLMAVQEEAFKALSKERKQEIYLESFKAIKASPISKSYHALASFIGFLGSNPYPPDEVDRWVVSRYTRGPLSLRELTESYLFANRRKKIPNNLALDIFNFNTAGQFEGLDRFSLSFFSHAIANQSYEDPQALRDAFYQKLSQSDSALIQATLAQLPKAFFSQAYEAMGFGPKAKECIKGFEDL